MNRKTILSAATLAMAFGLASATLPAAAKEDVAKMATMADTDKDAMISKEEFLAMAAKQYDEKVAAMMKMPAAQAAKMVKDNKMTFDGYREYWKQYGQ